MHENPDAFQPFSDDARHVFVLLGKRGGCMRPGPLIAASRLSPDRLAAALDELAERRWISIKLRATRPRTPPLHLAPAFRPIECIATTSFGRWRHSVTWLW